MALDQLDERLIRIAGGGQRRYGSSSHSRADDRERGAGGQDMATVDAKAPRGGARSAVRGHWGGIGGGGEEVAGRG